METAQLVEFARRRANGAVPKRRNTKTAQYKKGALPKPRNANRREVPNGATCRTARGAEQRNVPNGARMT